jgi:antitoxin component YwqK of YwqJK toxin-antitoxin module
MKTNFLFSLIILIPFSLFSQQKKYMAFDDEWRVATSPDNTFFSCNCFVNEADKFIGKFRCYNLKLEVLVKEYSFENDILHGVVKEYFENGQVKLEAEYMDGLPISDWKEYDEKGALVLHRTFNEQSQLVRDYFQDLTPYSQGMAFSHKKEELPIYTTDCIQVKIESQKYSCSDQAIADYLSNSPTPEALKKDPVYSGKKFECILMYTISEKGVVETAEVLKSTGDEFLDMLAQAHVLNMVPFESAKQYGVPIPYNKDARIIFQF